MAPQPDAGLDVGLAIDTLLTSVHGPADGTSSVLSHAGSHPSIGVAPVVLDGLEAVDALITHPFPPPPSSILLQTNEPTSEPSPASFLGLCSPPPLSNPLPAAAPFEHPNEPEQPNEQAGAEPFLMMSICPTSHIILTFPQAITAVPTATFPINKQAVVPPSPPPPPTVTPSTCCFPDPNLAPPQLITAAPPTASSGPSNKTSHSSPPTATQSAHHSSDPIQTPPVITAVPIQLPHTSTDNMWNRMPIAPSTTTMTPHGQSGSVPPVIMEKKRKRVMEETHNDQDGRGQRQRKALATKEVILLTDAKCLDLHIAWYIFMFFFPL
ncbi:hypothetical protein L208DRAFT_1380661 [Tricholoma matsutake]|nr:hypothetical protein L208DRAFT_1380661 [Tricholoma matsutake 945]